MSGSQRYRAAHKGTGRQTNDTGRRTKGKEGTTRENKGICTYLQISPYNELGCSQVSMNL
jgi:hypothetical protein